MRIQEFLLMNGCGDGWLFQDNMGQVWFTDGMPRRKEGKNGIEYGVDELLSTTILQVPNKLYKKPVEALNRVYRVLEGFIQDYGVAK